MTIGGGEENDKLVAGPTSLCFDLVHIKTGDLLRRLRMSNVENSNNKFE